MYKWLLGSVFFVFVFVLSLSSVKLPGALLSRHILSQGSYFYSHTYIFKIPNQLKK